MTDFFRFPSTPHLAWIGRGELPREDKILSSSEARALLARDVVVEEKIDGANVGVSLADDGGFRVQNRGQYLSPPYKGQFARLHDWLREFELPLSNLLDERLILFGEWSAARHSIGYDRLPDWFLLFDVYDRIEARFWSSRRRDAWASVAGLASVPVLMRGTTNLADLEVLLATNQSRYRTGPMEGVIVRQDTSEWCSKRAKLVRADFTQMIGEHWSKRRIEWNRKDWSYR